MHTPACSDGKSNEYYGIEALWLLLKLKDESQGKYVIEGRKREIVTVVRPQRTYSVWRTW